MKLLFDENLPRRLCRLLKGFGDLRHVIEFGLVETDDRRIWDFARENGYVIVTRDRDFFQRALLIGPPPQIVWLKMGNASTAQFASLLTDSRSALEDFEREASSAFLILPPGLLI